jgi:antitoxin component HigA of HigAB toxin-antitoxin module
MEADMSIYEKLQDGLNEGLNYSIETSKKLLEKAKETAAEVEEVSILKIDLRRFNTKKKELISELGIKAYEAFLINERKSLTLSSSGVNQIVEELREIEKKIVDKEEELKKAE